jgi:hypothetical protein
VRGLLRFEEARALAKDAGLNPQAVAPAPDRARWQKLFELFQR